MQIFEITSRQKVNEIDWGATAKAVTNRLATNMAQKIGITAPPIDSDEQNPFAGADAQTKARRSAEPVIAQQGRQLAALWTKAIAPVIALQRAQKPVPPAQLTNLRTNLMQQIHNNLLQGKLGKDFTELSNMVDQQYAPQAHSAVTRIERAITDIMDIDPNKRPDILQAEFHDLAQAAYDAMSLKQFTLDTDQAPSIILNNQGFWQIGTTVIDPNRTKQLGLIADLINFEKQKSGRPPIITISPTGKYYLGKYELEPTDPIEGSLINIIKAAARNP
jgi:hypothetical protein